MNLCESTVATGICYVLLSLTRLAALDLEAGTPS